MDGWGISHASSRVMQLLWGQSCNSGCFNMHKFKVTNTGLAAALTATVVCLAVTTSDVQLESGKFCSQLCNVCLVSEFLTVLCAGYYTEGQVKVCICHMCDTSEIVRNFFTLNHLKNEQMITQLLNNVETDGSEETLRHSVREISIM